MKFSTDFPNTRELTSNSAAFTPPGKRAHRFLFNSMALVANTEMEKDEDRPKPPPQQPDAADVHTPVTTKEG